MARLQASPASGWPAGPGHRYWRASFVACYVDRPTSPPPRVKGGACAFLTDCSIWPASAGRMAPGITPRHFMATARKILIVDDDIELREALVEQLSLHEEFEAISVESGTKGVQAAKGGQIDLVIMDVGLPDIDG